MSEDKNCPVARKKEFHCPWFEKEWQIIVSLRAEVATQAALIEALKRDLRCYEAEADAPTVCEGATE